jgi:hypothetical protein
MFTFAKIPVCLGLFLVFIWPSYIDLACNKTFLIVQIKVCICTGSEVSG